MAHAQDRDERCGRCRAIDLEAAFKPHPSRCWGRTVTNLGNLSDRLRESNCPLCRLFYSVRVEVNWADVYYPKPKRRDEHHLRAFVPNEISTPGRHVYGVGKEQVLLGVAPGEGGDYLPPEYLTDCIAAGLISRVSAGLLSNPCNFIHTVNSTSANLVQVSDWLRHCSSHHDQTCRPRESRAAVSLKVIDCLHGEVVPLGDKDDYFALSYVWGAPTASTKPTPPIEGITGSLPSSSVPQVIRDAISVVRGLGGRFLWVDKYCINQTASAEKDEQIRNMHLIYHSAVATIVSASRGDLGLGLPGIGETARKMQPEVALGEYIYISTMGEIGPSLHGSRWSGRGWTYQEGVFSRRSIFFTDDQVHFICRGMKCRESFDMERHDDWEPRMDEISRSSNVLNQAVIFNKTRKTQRSYGFARLWNFYAHLFNYRSRQLTYDSDAVNAFRGILSGFGYQHLWGVPIALPKPEDGKDFDARRYDLGLVQGIWMEELIGLYCDSPWQTDFEFLRRNAEFPTWSWAGWTGGLRMPREEQPTQFNQIWVTDNTPRFQIEFLDGRTMSVQEYYSKVELEPQIARLLSHTLIVDGTVVQVTFQRHSKEFLEKTGIAAYWCPCHQDTPALHGDEDERQKFPHLRLYEEHSAKSCFDGRLFRRQWDALILADCMWATRDTDTWLLILNRDGESYRAVGKVYITAHFLDGGKDGKAGKVMWKSQRKRLRLI